MSDAMRHWIAVASAEHVSLGRSLGIMQVCHGKAAPLRRISPGDQVIYYSPVSRFGGKDRLQAFTAIGTVMDAVPYQVEMTPGFRPWRRDVQWHTAYEAPIRPLLGRLAFTGDGANWGYRFRFGLFGITVEDAALIATAMMADVPLEWSALADQGRASDPYARAFPASPPGPLDIRAPMSSDSSA